MRPITTQAAPASRDQATANAFAKSWNNLPPRPVYSAEQHADWLLPLTADDIRDQAVLELGCGNGSLLYYTSLWQPGRLVGVDLGESVRSAKLIMARSPYQNWAIEQADLTRYTAGPFDVVYCIGVLHHLKEPEPGFDAMLRNLKPGGRFHGWVYAKEGNRMVRATVEPLRRIVSRWPWPIVKYGIATPLAVPFFGYAKLAARLANLPGSRHLPLFSYCQWIARREFGFFRHVAFDQLVSPQTRFFDRATVAGWLSSRLVIQPGSTYLELRNGNSWKFGGRVRNDA